MASTVIFRDYLLAIYTSNTGNQEAIKLYAAEYPVIPDILEMAFNNHFLN